MVSVLRNGQRDATERRNVSSESVTAQADSGRAVPEVVAGLQESLTRLLRADDSESARIELTRIAESRQATVAMLQSLVTLGERITRTEAMVQEIRDILKGQQPQKEWYTVAELATVLGKAEFTVREWCRLGRVNADKRQCGRGNSQEWIVSHQEMTRIQNHGLLPD